MGIHMTTTKSELQKFTEFANAKLSKSDTDISLDELFDLWRSENPSDALYAENVAAVNAAIQDFNKGDRGVSADDTSAQLRREFDINAE